MVNQTWLREFQLTTLGAAPVPSAKVRSVCLAAIVIALPAAAGAFAGLPIDTSSVPPLFATVPMRVFRYWLPFTS
ncbi:hypothetical protein FEP99_05961 [Burkholderia pseudomultivorans]|nr:hypothetical protein [Burkholderia pseudomultivorans]